MGQTNENIDGKPTNTQINHGAEGDQRNINRGGEPRNIQKNYTAADVSRVALELRLDRADLAEDRKGFFDKVKTKLPGLTWDVFIALLPLIFR